MGIQRKEVKSGPETIFKQDGWSKIRENISNFFGVWPERNFLSVSGKIKRGKVKIFGGNKNETLNHNLHQFYYF
jgi:hypothetical protein